MSNSIWLRTDLHIHSKKSNEIKNGDYTGPEYSGEEILNKLLHLDIPVRLFSITDHNIINTKLYSEIESLITTDKYNGKINYLIGVELDIHDKKIYKDKFHTLCFFKSRDIGKIDKVIKSLNLKEETDCIDDLYNLFQRINEKELGNFILIPHFSNKSQGLPSSLKELDQLTRLVFDAYEDSNNVENIKKSLAIYLKSGYVDFPFVAFTDCHDIRNYPKTNANEEDRLICDFLGSIDFPFDSLKTTFEEPRLRISIQNVDLMRNSKYNNQMISKIYNNGISIDISNWLNSIIGPFGSGKSLLIDKVVNGIDGIDSKYNTVVNKNTSTFEIEIEGTKYSSIREAISSDALQQLIEVKQYEKLFYDSEIKNEYMEELSIRLGFNLPSLQNVNINHNIDELIRLKDQTELLFKERSNAYSFRYDKAFTDNKGYFVKEEELVLDFESASKAINANKLDVDQLSKLVLNRYKIFRQVDLNKFNNVNTVLDNKLSLLNYIRDGLLIFLDYNKTGIRDFNLANDISKDKEHINQVENTIKNYSKSMCLLVKSISSVAKVWEKDVFDIYSKMSKHETINDYKIVIEYNLNGVEYKPILKHLYSSVVSGETLTSRFLKSIKNNEKLKNSKDFSSKNIRDSIEKYQKEYMEKFSTANTTYDLLFDVANNKSIVGLSAGGRAKELLKMAFSKIYSNLKENVKTIVVIDQPENNMDNNNIKNLVVENIKKIKLEDKNNLIQFLIVTHNANVSITSDSENIIIASNTENVFDYNNGSIENEKYINGVCDILEGGRKALKTRAVKYNINILKGMEITK